MKHASRQVAPSRRATALLIAAAIATLTACAPEVEPPLPRATSIAAGAATSDAVLENSLQPENPGCSAAVARRGEVVWSGARGLASANDPITTATEFDIASVSKQFTATAVLLLEEDGALSLDDPLSDFADYLPQWSRDVTVGALMNHSAGIPDYTGALIEAGIELSEPASQADALDAIAGMKALENPGKFAYSNSHYVLLAEIVHAVSGQTLGEFLDERVFGPAGLALRVDPASTDPGVARGFSNLAGAWRPSPSKWTQLGDGSIVTTPSELARSGDRFRSTGDDWAETIGMTTPSGTIYGPGIELHSDGSLSHSGGWAGTVTQFEVSADRETTIAVSCNFDGAPVQAIADDLSLVWIG